MIWVNPGSRREHQKNFEEAAKFTDVPYPPLMRLKRDLFGTTQHCRREQEKIFELVAKLTDVPYYRDFPLGATPYYRWEQEKNFEEAAKLTDVPYHPLIRLKMAISSSGSGYYQHLDILAKIPFLESWRCG